VARTKIRIASIGEENQERREEEKLKEEAESSYVSCPQGCEDISIELHALAS
jgi:hypothetical protein